VATLVRLLALEGVKRIAVVSADPGRLPAAQLPEQATVHGREEIEEVLRALATTPGVTVLLYDGECANERRRKQKRGLRAGASRFALVNEEVCENCGHCGTVSNCISLHKVETELGPKTRIHASTCNQDLLCLEGDCPSFVTVDVEGGGPRRRAPPALAEDALPEPSVARGDGPYRIVIPGTGGTGVLTVSALLGWAAHLEGLEVLSYDQTGAAQKWGSVLSCLAISDPASPAPPPSSSKAGMGRADLYLACDAMAASDPLNLERCDPSRTAAVIHTTLFPSGEMIRNVDLDPGADRMIGAIEAVCRPDRTVKVEARRLAEALFDDHLAANVFLLGVASQAGLLPVTARALEAAIALNGTLPGQNLQAFRQGRLHQARASGEVRDPAPAAPPVEDAAATVEREAAALGRGGPAYRALMDRCSGLPEAERRMLAFRAAELFRYQDAALAGRYLDRVLQVALREHRALGDAGDLSITREAIRQFHRLMAYKDEYEVARLHLRGDARRRAGEMFEGRLRVRYQLHPPALRALGMRRKVAVGRWIEPGFRALRALRGLRGTAFDPFGGSASRRLERRLPDWYETALLVGLERLRPDTLSRVLELARLPEHIRGYERIKAEGAEQAMRRAEEILRELRDDRAPPGAP
jgi:indolepyruvate ferredoxin oxidoreductase